MGNLLHRRKAFRINDNFDFTVTTTTSSESFTIHCRDEIGTFDATVDWGDGSTSAITAFDDADLAHTYATAGDHDISISGTFVNINFNNTNAATDRTKVKSVTNMGSVGWLSLFNAFKGCSNMTSFDAGDCDTSSVTNMVGLFRDCGSLTSANVSSFDTSSVTTMFRMFQNCSSLTSVDLSSFDTSSCTTGFASYLFETNSLASVDLSSFDVSNTTGGANDMFKNMGTSVTSQVTITGIEDLEFNGLGANKMRNWILGNSLSTAVYDELLVNYAALTWSNYQNPNFGSSTYTASSAAATARAALVTAGWTITDGGGITFPTTNLVAFYKLDESSGDALDISGNGRTFTDNGTVASTTATIGGETVNVRSLDRGSGKYFSRADDDNLDVGDGESFTISFWAKVSSSWANYSSGGVFSKRNAVGASDAGYTIDLARYSNNVRFRYNGVSDGSTTVGDTNTDTGVATDAWAHYMMVFTADATVITYVNNAQHNSDDASSVTGSLANSIPSYIGQRAYNSTGSAMFDVSHIGFWKKALTSSERDSLYNSGKVFAPVAPVPLQTRTVTFDSSDAAVFTIDSDSGQKIWTDQKFDQADISNGLRLWNGSEAGNSGASESSGKWVFGSGGDCTTWWDNYWMRVKQDPGTGTYSDWINLVDADGLIYTSCQPEYNNMGSSVVHYTGPGTWTNHAAGFKYQVEIYSVSSRPQ